MKTILAIGIIIIGLFLNEQYQISKTTIAEYGQEEFLPTKFEDGIIFSLKEDDENFYNLYYSEIIEKEELEEPIEIKISYKSKFSHFAPAEYIEETGEFFFTSNNLNSQSGIKKLAIFKAQIEDLKLKNIVRLKICNINFNYCHPTFSRDGLTMILSSDENGELNLFKYTRSNIDSNWGLVRSLDEINTNDFDSFPNLINDSLLVFSSYGKEQTSSLNLYLSELNETGKWEEPKFMEYLSSEYDDFGITFINQESGYLSSKRDGQDNIFYFEK